MNPRGQRFA